MKSVLSMTLTILTVALIALTSFAALVQAESYGRTARFERGFYRHSAG